MEQAIKQIKHKRPIADDDVPGVVLTLLGEDGIKIMTQLTNNTYPTGQWPKDFIEVTMIALKKRPRATQCSGHCTTTLITHTEKTVTRILRRTESKSENVLGEDQFRFRTGK
jgi:hypothetical protein